MLEAIPPALTNPLVTIMLLSPPPCLRFLPSWAPSLAASLLPVVYFLLRYPAKEVGGEYPWPKRPTSFVSITLREEKGVRQGKPH